MCSSVMTRRPPSSTLFPYTTLFRSFAMSTLASTAAGANASVDIANFAFDPATVTINAGETVTWTNHDQDRKSTRLNSSHVEISYAVFCLKKKKRATIADQGAHEDRQ